MNFYLSQACNQNFFQIMGEILWFHFSVIHKSFREKYNGKKNDKCNLIIISPSDILNKNTKLKGATRGH